MKALSWNLAIAAVPLSDSALEDKRRLKLIQQVYLFGGGTYGGPWIHRDLREIDGLHLR